jgi:ammonia channel protein AmtB
MMNGLWGTIATAFFKKQDGIFYGGANCGTLLGVQILGCVVVILWSGFFSLLFFSIANKLGILRISE